MYNRFEKGLQPRQSVTDYLVAVKEETQQLEEELEALEEVRQSLLLTFFADDCGSGKSLSWLRMCEMQQHSHFIFLCSVASNSLRPHGLVCQAPLSMGFPRQEYWSGLPFPPGDLPDPGIKPCLMCLLH